MSTCTFSGKNASVLLTSSILLSFPSVIGADQMMKDICETKEYIHFNTDFHGQDLSSAGRCFELEIPAAGFVTLEVVVSPDRETGARIGVLKEGCTNHDRNSLIEVFRSATSYLLYSHTRRTVDFCVGSEDPLRRLEEYRLYTSFYEDGPTDHTEDPEEIELEPEGLRNAPMFPSKTEDPEEIELEPEGLRAAPLKRLCSIQRLDDHGDTFLCATQLVLGRLAGGRAEGVLDNARGADTDVFAFELDELRTVRIKTTGDLDTRAALYDRNGQSLGRAHGGRPDDNFRMVRTLGPGLYFVRVGGSLFSQGDYTLHIDTIPTAW